MPTPVVKLEMCEFCGDRRSQPLELHTVKVSENRCKELWLCPKCVKTQNWDNTNCKECTAVIDWQDQVHRPDGIYCKLCRPMEDDRQELMDIVRIDPYLSRHGGRRDPRSDD